MSKQYVRVESGELFRNGSDGGPQLKVRLETGEVLVVRISEKQAKTFEKAVKALDAAKQSVLVAHVAGFMAMIEREHQVERFYEDNPDFPQSEVVKYSLVPEPNADAFNAVAHDLVVNWPMVREAAEAWDLGAITSEQFQGVVAEPLERLRRHGDFQPRTIGHVDL